MSISAVVAFHSFFPILSISLPILSIYVDHSSINVRMLPHCFAGAFEDLHVIIIEGSLNSNFRQYGELKSR